jgi:hypothetical protein
VVACLVPSSCLTQNRPVDPLVDGPLQAQWQALMGRLNTEPHSEVVIWGAENAGDAIFMAMACAQFEGRPDLLMRVPVPAMGDRPAIAMHAPAQLAALYAARQTVGAEARTWLEQDFRRIVQEDRALQYWVQGQIVGRPVDSCDPLLLAACGADWRAAAQVVGIAMGQCDAHNMLSELFFWRRLHALLDAARIDANMPHPPGRRFDVRLAAP